MHQPFYREDSVDYSEMFTDALVDVLGAGGLDQFSVGAVARWMQLTPQAILQRCGGRARLLEWVTDSFARRWLGWSSRVGPEEFGLNPLGALPATDHERLGVRVWQALAELARGELVAGRPGPSLIVSECRAQERQLLSWALRDHWGRSPAEWDCDGWETDAAFALLEGVRFALARESEPMPLERGREVIRNWLSTTNCGAEAIGCRQPITKGVTPEAPTAPGLS